MNQKHVKVGQFYNHTSKFGGPYKVLVKGRVVEPKSGIVKFEVWEEDSQEPDFVPARELSPAV